MYASLAAAGNASLPVVPFVKQWTPGDGTVRAASVAVQADGQELASEAAALRAGLAELGIPTASDGLPVRLRRAAVTLPAISSDYREQIADQAYRLRIAPREVVIEGRTAAGVFYGVQTLLQLLGGDAAVPVGEVVDWPDLAERMVMIDSARQNENAEYYARLIRFLARHKINVLHWHLTDDENLALYHEDYAALLHPHAWRPEQIRALVALAREQHIEVIPEIESLGHARVFTRHPDYREYLHQTTFDKPTKNWAGTDVPGFTNVLCPGSSKTYDYLDRMYARAAEAFPSPLLHVGLDEVEATTCARCEQVAPGSSFADWITRHLLRCHKLVAGQHRKMAMWGDMLLHHRAIVDKLPEQDVLIFDWHYRREVEPESARFFQARGFEVIGCPALMCHPRMILPDDENFENIAAFARVARETDLRGLDTTIWIPTRYMSDVLWPGIAFAAAQSWSGSRWDDAAFYAGFVRDFFGSPDGAAFADAWREACHMRWWLEQFYPACWMDEQSLDEARGIVDRKEAEVRGLLERLVQAEQKLKRLTPSVRRNEVAWTTILQSVATRAYTMKHLLAAPQVQADGRWNVALLKELDAGCGAALGWIEADWDRNRFADDPNKNGVYKREQNLLYRFRQMHAFHERILNELARPEQP